MLRGMSTVWDEARRDFPALERWVYLNAAAASPIPRPVHEAVSTYYQELTEGDLHWDTWLARREAIRERVARLIGAEADEIAFVPNTSTGMNLIVDVLAPDGAVLTDELEFPAVTLPWIHRGLPVNFVPAVEGVPRLESFHASQAARAGTIAISHVQFSNGCRLDLDSFGAIKGYRHLVVSASQSAGAFPIDVERSRIDGLAAAGHKWLCAGYGSGFVYLRRAILERRPPRAIGWLSVEDPFAFDNREYRLLEGNRRNELGCPPFASIFALGAAVDYLTGIGIDAIAEYVLSLNSYLTLRLGKAGFTVLSPGGDHRSGQTLVALPDGRAAAAHLKRRAILVTAKPEGVRISTHFYNNEADIDACVAALVEYRASPEWPRSQA